LRGLRAGVPAGSTQAARDRYLNPIHVTGF
jgi:hypothetical protein